MTDITATGFFRRTAASAAPRFEHEETETGGTKRPTRVRLQALHPETGEEMGHLTYDVPRRKADKIYINKLETHPEHRHKGVGSALMDEMQHRHPGTPIEHGDRTPDGAAWWKRYTDGKSVSRGRTIASLSDFFRSATAHPGPPAESFAQQDGEDHYDWQNRVRRGLSLGHLTHEQAEAHKYYGKGHESNGWQPLPHTLYHTTTDVAGVQQHGLKSGSELGQKNGHGLGGTPDYLSMTDSAEHAHTMLHALHEYHDVLNGKTTMHDLKDAADRGEGAKHPFGKEYTGIFGHDPDHAQATMNEHVIEPGFRTHDEAAEQGLTPHPTRHMDFGETKDGRRAGSGWIRPMTDREKLNKRHEAYSAFSQARHWAGEGKPGVLFLANDRAAFAAKDPSNFGVIKVRPKPGAQGHYLPGEHEWRTGTGDAVETHGEPLRRTSARIGAAKHHKTCPCCNGTGEHYDTGFECYHCDTAGDVPADSPDDASCDGAQADGGSSHTATLDQAMPPFPVTAAELGVYGPPDRWYHASPHNLEESGFEEGHTRRGHDEEAGKHWNSHLGIHFTSDHGTARDLAEEMHGTVHHVSLSMENPKHYHSENDLTDEAHAWTAAHPEFSRDLPKTHDPDVPAGALREGDLRHHPRIAEVGRAFRDHLREHGHDGITYGNEYEGPRGHLSAIAFSPHEATIDGAHSWDEDDDKDLDERPVKYAARRQMAASPPQKPYYPGHDHGESDGPMSYGGWTLNGRPWDEATQQHIASASTPVPDNNEPYEHKHDWLPHGHFFAPAHKDLDPRLFDGDHLRPEVRREILGLINSFWAPKYGDTWQSWARVYLAGSEASHFYGNNDLDVLIGIDYDAARHYVDAFTGEPNGELDTKLTDELREHLNDGHRMLPGPAGQTGPWDSTFYCNPGSYDIRAIKPYAAYDITRDEWAVRPVQVPDDFGPTKLPESTWDVLDALRALVKAVAELPPGTREREGAALYDYLHSDRHAAFGPEGDGLYDPANADWKALDAAPGHPLQQLIDWKHSHDGATTDQENAA
ncbi:GNAT family N-acetyltransferase [Streptomyces sp. NPDC008079]|uniref:GNAT family N-acetyltransferase n=1 Tax=Streptomyces sp. NPDC008079 TaxID=3364806 RepID=UPI0036E8FBCF